MIRAMTALIAGAIALSVVLVQAQEFYTGGTARSDVNGNGTVNAQDLGIAATDFNKHFPPNPCTVYWVNDGTPIADEIVNTYGEIVTPQRGGQWLVPSNHPVYDSIRQGTPPAALWPCP